MLATVASPDNLPSASVATNVSKLPLNVPASLCFTAKPTDECTGSACHVPAGTACSTIVLIPFLLCLFWLCRPRSCRSIQGGQCSGPPSARIDPGAEEDQQPGQVVLPLDADLQERRRVDDLLDQERPEKRADERAAAAEDAGTAENDRRDARERVADAGVRVADRDLGAEHDAARRGEKRTE